jgi:hypothetical protein
MFNSNGYDSLWSKSYPFFCSAVVSHGQNDQKRGNVENVQNLKFLPAYTFYIWYNCFLAILYSGSGTQSIWNPPKPKTQSIGTRQNPKPKALELARTQKRKM